HPWRADCTCVVARDPAQRHEPGSGRRRSSVFRLDASHRLSQLPRSRLEAPRGGLGADDLREPRWYDAAAVGYPCARAAASSADDLGEPGCRCDRAEHWEICRVRDRRTMTVSSPELAPVVLEVDSLCVELMNGAQIIEDFSLVMNRGE